MPETLKIQINPQVLLWARKEAGFKEKEIAAKLHIPYERYTSWESTGKEIPLGILKHISNYYKRQMAVFLLPVPPPELIKPKDYRNLAISKADLSPDTLLSIRRAHKYLELSKEILGDQYFINQYRWLEEIEILTQKKETIYSNSIIDWLRGKLKITIDEQEKFSGYDDAFRKWRNSIEKELGIYIFQFSMPKEELDGFCYAEETPPYAIVINSNTVKSRKIFTLFHELGHIFKHKSGICLPDITLDNNDIEFECNNFSGKFLIPDSIVFPINNIKDLGILANRFKVSREVYLRRNLERDFIIKKDFFGILKNLKEQPPPTKKEKKDIRIKRTILSKASRGETFFNLILEAVYTNKIDYITASDVLGLNFKHIEKNE
ncbi:MAG: ImmA/IrrE family metallo-endopeptidase [FCB group bacterium]|jgi:Zn-dependent peptidase ImmA (M78 family)/transcriptional regulator with XRE-family HTH domain